MIYVTWTVVQYSMPFLWRHFENMKTNKSSETRIKTLESLNNTDLPLNVT